MTFNFHFAARTAGDPTVDHDFRCPDEPYGCPKTKFAACTFNASTAQAVRAPFILCWEAQDEDTTGQQRVETCGTQAGLSAEQVQGIVDCGNGDLGTELMVEAAQYFMGRFPEWSKVTGPFNVPHVFVNDQDQYADIDYTSLLSALCTNGAEVNTCDTIV